MDRPIPLRPDRNAAREAAVSSLIRSGLAIARGVRERSPPSEIARRSWGSEAARDVALVTRAASAPATTTQAGWAAEISHVVLTFLESLIGQSAAAGLVSRGLQLSFAGNQTITLPTMATTPAAGFAGQSKPIPLASYTTAPGVSLSPHKFAVMTSLTHELLVSSNAEVVLRDQLANAAALGLDAAMFSSAGGGADQPPGLLSGITATTPSASTILTDAMLSDLSNLGGAVARIAGGNIIFICAPEQSIAIGVNAPNFAYPVLPTSALPKGTVIAVAANAFVSAFDPTPMLDASVEAEAHMETSPFEIVSSSGVVAAPVASVYQTDRILLRMRLPVSWALRTPAALAWASNVVW
jgi:hypothetical protein